MSPATPYIDLRIATIVGCHFVLPTVNLAAGLTLDGLPCSFL